MTNNGLDRQGLEIRVRRDYERFLGKVLCVYEAHYTGRHDSSIVSFQVGMLARVVKTPQADLFTWSDNLWLEPYWCIEPLKRSIDTRHYWVNGIRYCINVLSTIVERGWCVVDEWIIR